MADSKISQLSNAAALTGAEQVPVTQAWNTVKTTVSDIKSFSFNGVTTDSIPEGATNMYDKVVSLLAGAGISVTGTYPNFTVTNSSPDQVVSLTAGSGISITGTYPNFTVTATGGGGSGGHVIQDEGVSLPQRTNLNFKGKGITATDNAGADSTDVTVDEATLWELGTSIVSGGVITANVGTTNFAITSGVALFADSYTNPNSPVVNKVSFAGGTITDLFPSAAFTYLSVNPDGSIYQSTSNPTPSEKRDKAFLAIVAKSGGLVIGAAPRMMIAPNLSNTFEDFIRFIGAGNYSGNQFSANANLTLASTAGQIIRLGGNANISRKVPAIKDIDPKAAIDMIHYYVTTGGTVLANQAKTTNILVGFYNDPATGLVALPNNKHIVLYMYLSTSGDVLVLIGQKLYANVAEASANYEKDNPALSSQVINETFGDQLLRYALVIDNNVTNLQTEIANNQAALIPYSKFGSGTSGGAATNTTDFQTAFNNSTLPQIVTTVPKPTVQYQGGTGADIDKVFEVLNNLGVSKAFIRGDGSTTVTGLSTANTEIAGNYTASDTDNVILANATTASLVVTLPDATLAVNNSLIMVVKKTDSSANTVTITGTSGQTLDGVVNFVISRQNGTAWFKSNGTNWSRIGYDGDVTGPASATNNALAQYSGTSGKLLADGPTYGTASAANSIVQRDANQNITFNNWLGGYTTTATAAGTTTLTVSSAYEQYFTGTTTQTVTLPVTSTLTLGHGFEIINNSTGAVTVNSSGGNAVVVIAANQAAYVRCILTSGTTAASWDFRVVQKTYSGWSFSWGATASGTSGTGLALTVSNSASASTIGQSVTIGNTQTNAATGISLSSGTSAVWHTMLDVNIQWASSTQRGAKFTMWTGFTGKAIEIVTGGGTGNTDGIYWSSVQSGGSWTKTGIRQDTISWGAAGTWYGIYQTLIGGGGSGSAGLYQARISDNGTGTAYGWYVDQVVGASAAGWNTSVAWRVNALSAPGTGQSSCQFFSLNNAQSVNWLTGRAVSPAEITHSRTETRTTGTTADNFNLASFTRSSVINGAGGTFTQAGSVLSLANVETQTAGTLTSTVNVLRLTQSPISTGAGIYLSTTGTAKKAFRMDSGFTATSATTGTSGALPAQAAGYVIADVAGTTVKIPYFLN